MLQFNYNDGGRSKYFKATKVGDCVTRALAIATGKDYKEVYELVRKVSGDTPRNGVKKSVSKKVAEMLGGKWHACMQIGSGCTTHLRAGEIPMHGRIVCSVSKHLVAVIDGVINDTYDCSREADRCVYGYWVFEDEKPQKQSLLIRSRLTMDIDAVKVATMTAGELRECLAKVDANTPVIIRTGELQYGAVCEQNLCMANVGSTIKITR